MGLSLCEGLQVIFQAAECAFLAPSRPSPLLPATLEAFVPLPPISPARKEQLPCSSATILQPAASKASVDADNSLIA